MDGFACRSCDKGPFFGTIVTAILAIGASIVSGTITTIATAIAHTARGTVTGLEESVGVALKEDNHVSQSQMVPNLFR